MPCTGDAEAATPPDGRSAPPPPASVWSLLEGQLTEGRAMAGALTSSSSSLRGFLSAGASLRVLPSARTRAPGGAASCPCCSLGNSCACAVTVTEQVLLTGERLPHKPRPLGKPVLPFRLPLPQKAPAPRLLLPASPAASSSRPVRTLTQSTETAASGRRGRRGGRPEKAVAGHPQTGGSAKSSDWGGLGRTPGWPRRQAASSRGTGETHGSVPQADRESC